MKKMIKLALVLITSFSLGFAANAGELTVTGTAKATYNIQSSDGSGGNDNGKGLGITNELAFNGSGELDNGYTWAYMVALDPGAVTGSGTAAENDDTTMTLTTPYGTVGAFISAGGLNTSLKHSSGAYAPGIDLGLAQVIDPVDLGGYNSLQYHSPAGLIPFNTVIKAGYAPSGATGAGASGNAQGTTNTAVNDYDDSIGGATETDADFSPEAISSVSEYSITTSPIDGLTINASYVDLASNLQGGVSTRDYEAGAANVKYAYGPLTVGYGQVRIQPYLRAQTTAENTVRVKHLRQSDWSIGYAVNENLSLSYDKSSAEMHRTATSKANVDTKTKRTQDSVTIQAAYTIGGMTLALSQATIDGDGYTKELTGESRKDAKETIFAVTMAF